MKKYALLLTTASALILSASTFAEDTPPTETSLLQQISNQLNGLPSGITNGVTQGMSQGFTSLETSLEQFLDSRLQQTKAWVTSNNTQQLPNITNTVSLNNIQIPATSVLPANSTIAQGNLSLGQAVQAQTNQKTSDNVYNALTQFNFSLNKASSTASSIKAANGKPFSQYLQNTSEAQLILGKNSQASDSLYLSPNASLSSISTQLNDKQYLFPSSPLDNSQFDFSNLMGTTTYTASAVAAAKRFVTYFTLDSQSLLGDVNFSSLYNNAQKLVALKQSSAYQKYMLDIRNTIATRSVFLYNLHYLISERSPIANLGGAIGQPNTPASPLEVEKYRATHDIDSQQWLYSLQAQQPATVQKEILVTLKEIERQNYEAHIQREHIMSLLLAMGMQNSALLNQNLKVAQQKLQEAVDNAGKSGKKSTDNTPNNIPNSIQVTVSGETNTSANISWTAPKNATSNESYTITVTGGSGKPITQTANAQTALIVGLTAGTQYTVEVRSSQGVMGDASFTTKGTAPKK